MVFILQTTCKSCEWWSIWTARSFILHLHQKNLSCPTWTNNSLVYRDHDLSHFQMSFAGSGWSIKYFVFPGFFVFMYLKGGHWCRKKGGKCMIKANVQKCCFGVLEHTCIGISCIYGKEIFYFYPDAYFKFFLNKGCEWIHMLLKWNEENWNKLLNVCIATLSI